jgi:two-component system nitrogen regulation sensor histidine kinase NtrY
MSRHVEPTPAAPSAPRGRPRRVAFALPLCLAAATGLGVAIGQHLANGGVGGAGRLIWVSLALAPATALGVWLDRRASRPLSTAATLLDALRHGDYAHRARVDTVRSPSAALLSEVNELADHLERERLRRHETQALLDALIERLDVALLAFDAAELLVWWNPAAQVLLRSRLRLGAPANSLGALLDARTQRSVTLEAPGGPETFELRRGVFHRAGERYHFVLLSSSERVRREEERVAWQRLVRVLGHEVNTTLTPIQSLAGTCLSLLRARADSPPQVERALLAIEHRARGLSQFIADYARLARQPEPRLERLRLSACLTHVIALDDRCSVRVVAPSPVEVMADPVLLEQALANLLKNAIDASAETGGSVTVECQSNEAEVVLSINDEGAGIANHDNLFVPLFSTKEGGSGVGLVLARNIIEAHGGQLTLTNRARVRGAVAKITLPRAPLATSDGTPPRTERRGQAH